MLLGYFFKQIRQEAPREVRPGEPAPGSIVVAVEKMEQLRETGLPCAMRFGIVETAQSIIWQRCESEKLEEPNFKVQRMSVAEFAAGMPMYECAIEGGRLRDKVLMRAQIFVGRRTRELCSYPGDDFAAAETQAPWEEAARIRAYARRNGGRKGWFGATLVDTVEDGAQRKPDMARLGRCCQ